MNDDELLARIVIDPRIMVGQPCIQGSRLTVHLIVNLLAHGTTYEELFEDYPRLTTDDIRACLLYAVGAVKREFAASQTTNSQVAKA